jgi:myo-inositol catabolism protein IolC
MGIPGTPTPQEAARIREAKGVIFAGFRRAIAEGSSLSGSGILVDEEHGAGIARSAHELGIAFAMPVERSGRAEFDFEYGEAFGEHISAFDPTYAKVLVRYNPAGDAALNGRQGARLARLTTWLHDRNGRLMFELLVPAEAGQLAHVGGDADRYDRELRPGLMVDAIRALQDAGVEPDIWKIEGLESRDDCVRVADAARAGGREHVGCVVLGRGGDEARVARWLRVGAGVPGYVGFAVGRTIWWDAIARWLVDGDTDHAAGTIADAYRRLVDAYEEAAR